MVAIEIVYDIGYDIQSLNMAVCFEILILYFLSNLYIIAKFFIVLFIAAKSCIVNMFFLFLITSINYINNHWLYILSHRSNLVDLLQNHKFF